MTLFTPPRFTTVTTLTATALVLLIMAGCEKQGPAERAGEALDDAARDTQEQLKELGDDTR